MNTSYRDTIARRFTWVTASIIVLVFIVIYLVVNYSVIENIDRELGLETQEHVDEIAIVDGEIRFTHRDEWLEKEHNQIQLNPIFIEIVDLKGKTMDRSPNLGNNHLNFDPILSHQKETKTLKVGIQEVRQVQTPLNYEGKPQGYLLVATSFQESRELLTNLRNVLLLLYPGILLSLFFSMRILAGKSIEPIRKIIQKTNQITQSNLNERVPESEQNDEIGQLTRSINNLLSRLEEALIREKQFTSDASHELRTPLAVLRGTLEVLIRKPRTAEEYKEKIQTSLKSIDRMSLLIDQLLALARVSKTDQDNLDEVELHTFTEEIADQAKKETGRSIRFHSYLTEPLFVRVNEDSLTMILNNLIQNAVKYSELDTEIELVVGIQESQPFISVEDHGRGISKDSLEKIFDSFYREPDVIELLIPGTGLGLALVKKLALESGIRVEVASEKGTGTSFSLFFAKSDLSKS